MTKGKGQIRHREVAGNGHTPRVFLTKDADAFVKKNPRYGLFHGTCEQLLKTLPNKPLFDLIVTSPPYNIGKPYEQKVELELYRTAQKSVISELVQRLKPNGSLCWQVGNYVVSNKNNRGSIYPLDYLFHPIFQELDLVLRNRIVWTFGHGLHCKHRFSGRYEVILWYTRNGEYYFDLDAVRVKPKYPGKRHYKGPQIGKLSSNPRGKNPEDVWSVECRDLNANVEDLWEGLWDIPNVKSNHVEKRSHPCQFPVGLVERLVKALCPINGLVFDPYAGVASAGVAAAANSRRFWGAELVSEYVRIGSEWMADAVQGKARYRPHDRPIYDHTQSPLSRLPQEAELSFKFDKE